MIDGSILRMHFMCRHIDKSVCCAKRHFGESA